MLPARRHRRGRRRSLPHGPGWISGGLVAACLGGPSCPCVCDGYYYRQQPSRTVSIWLQVLLGSVELYEVKLLLRRGCGWLVGGLPWFPLSNMPVQGGPEPMPRTLGPETPGTRRRLGQSSVTLATSGGTRFADVVFSFTCMDCPILSCFGYDTVSRGTVKWYVVGSYPICPSLLLPCLE